MRASETRKVGDIHPNGKWIWTEYKEGKFDWRAIKGTKKEEVKEEVKKTTSKKEEKFNFTKPQKDLYEKLSNGFLIKTVYVGKTYEYHFLQTNELVSYRTFWNVVRVIAKKEGKSENEISKRFFFVDDFSRFEEVMSEINYSTLKAAVRREGKILPSKDEFMDYMREIWKGLSDDQKEGIINNFHNNFGDGRTIKL